MVYKGHGKVGKAFLRTVVHHVVLRSAYRGCVIPGFRFIVACTLVLVANHSTYLQFVIGIARFYRSMDIDICKRNDIRITGVWIPIASDTFSHIAFIVKPCVAQHLYLYIR